MGSSPVRVTSKKDRQNAYPFLLFGNPYGKYEEPIGSCEEKTLFSTTLSERSPLAEYRRFPYGSPALGIYALNHCIDE